MMLYNLKKVWINLLKLYLRKKSAKKVFFVSNYPLLPPWKELTAQIDNRGVRQ